MLKPGALSMPDLTSTPGSSALSGQSTGSAERGRFEVIPGQATHARSDALLVVTRSY